MSYRILERDTDWIVKFDEPDPCCATIDLRQPIDAGLRHGIWLVLVVPAWSAPDRSAIDQAMKAVKAFGGQLRLGVGIFDSHDEVYSWNPQLQTRWQTPIWALMKDGAVYLERGGMLTDAELTQFLRCPVTHTCQ